ncbi:MAG: hypothetical protein ABI348_04990 [Nitrososphaera sp.]|jgi:hypothetical protein
MSTTNNNSGTRAATGCTLAILLLLTGYAAYPLIIGTAHAQSSENLTIQAFSLPDGNPVNVLVEIRASNPDLVKSGFAPQSIAGQAGTIYTIKVSNSQSYAFDHWQDGSKSNIKAVLFSKGTTLVAFFKKVSTPPNLTVSAVTANGEELHMWTTVRSGIQAVSSGLTPFTFTGASGRTYEVTVGDQNAEGVPLGEGPSSTFGPVRTSIIFNHWQDNVNDRSVTRDVTIPVNGSSMNLVGVYNKGDRVTLEDLGVLQLVSHDLYNTIRDGPNPGSIEDERLNLSTVLDHGEDQIILGGEPRNSENIALHTVAVKLGKMYLDLVVDKKESPEDAREQVVQVYLQMVAKAYQDTFGEPLPDPAPSEHEENPDGSENLTGDLSLRAIHSYVPGHIMVNGVDMMILDPSLRGKTLSDEDMQQLSKPLDGTFDPVFRNVTIFLPPPNPPPNTFTIDLFERDSSFAKQFGTDVSFEEFMDELKDGRFDQNEKVMSYLREDIANGLMPPDGEGGDEKKSGDNAAAAAEEAAVNATAPAPATAPTNVTVSAPAAVTTAAPPLTSNLEAETSQEQVVTDSSSGSIEEQQPAANNNSGGDEQGSTNDGGDGNQVDEEDNGDQHWSVDDTNGHQREHDDDSGGDSGHNRHDDERDNGHDRRSGDDHDDDGHHGERDSRGGRHNDDGDNNSGSHGNDDRDFSFPRLTDILQR